MSACPSTSSTPPYPVLRRWPYRVQQRIVPSYRVGRVALAGDAAHVNSPAGGMGLNAGIHDAFALAEALVDCVKHGAPLSRLDLYDRRRRPVVAEHILGQAGRNRDRMREKDPTKRRAILADLQAIARDRDKHRAFVRRASMIDGLRQAAAVE
jgi:3-(3-hydroxy-phenyl)propionate hydroxylase